MLAGAGHLKVVHDNTSAASLLKDLQHVQTDVLLLGMQLSDTDSTEVCKQLRKAYPQLRIIALTSFIESHHIRQIMRNGATGYLLKNTDQATLIGAIEKVYAGEQFLDPALQQHMLQEVISGQKRPVYDIPLTRREKEILKLIAEEHSNQEIADMLYISLRTVETHRLNITQKLAVKNTAGLVKEAIRRGLTE